MIRRVHVIDLHPGSIALDPAEAHHIRDVLRLEVGSPLELFDDAGQTAAGIIKHITVGNVVVEVDAINAAARGTMRVIVAAAIPKGDRADWMVEKLAELGVDRFIPLAAERSVVLPAGRNKIERWERTAIESAKQSRRSGVMSIAPLTPLDEAIKAMRCGWFLSTAADALPARTALQSVSPNNLRSGRPEGALLSENTTVPLRGDRCAMPDEITLFIGPEGGWTDGEIAKMTTAGLTGVALTSTILRVETAAITAAGVLLCCMETHSPPSTDSTTPSSR